ncbi:MAG: DUF5696 domain-containing protein [Chloroflexi bacterium]|nr:DUF5696 domain-containing protein [Chloroflexota bacterium]
MMAEQWLLQNDVLQVLVDADTLAVGVIHKGSGLRWQFTTHPAGEVRIDHGGSEAIINWSDARTRTPRRYTTAREQRMTILTEGLPGGVAAGITFALPCDEPALRIEVEPYPTSSTSEIAEVWYPGPLELVDDQPIYTVWPNMAGTLIPARYNRDIGIRPDPQDASRNAAHTNHMALGRTLYEPWWGVVGAKGAYIAIAETPFDFALDLQHTSGGPTRTSPTWVSSLGRLAYPRMIRYQFLPEADHTALAKTYRAYTQHAGRWISLQDKFERNPVAKRLVGSLIFPVTVNYRTQQDRSAAMHLETFEALAEHLKQLPALGVEKAYFHVDGWGFHGYDSHHPDVLPPCLEAGGWEGLVRFSRAAQKCGYLFGLHDQYRDYYLDSLAFQEKRTIKSQNGSWPHYSAWAGGPQSIICAKESMQYVRRTFTELLARGVVLTGSYLDVFAVVDMDECFAPNHPMTREDCFIWRAKMLDYVRELGIAISSEEPVDHFMPHLDFCHWADFPRFEFMRGEALGIPAPLHNLVYHDSLLLPAVWDYGYDPALRSEFFLEGLAQVEIPYARPEWGTREEFTDAQFMARLHQAWGTHELLAHRLLDTDGHIQEYIYPEGSVAIDLEHKSYRILGGPCATDGWVSSPIGG